jgi:hypothetical protein
MIHIKRGEERESDREEGQIKKDERERRKRDERERQER